MSEYYPMLKKELDCCVVLHDLRPAFYGMRYILERDGSFGQDTENAWRFATRGEAQLWAIRSRDRLKKLMTIQVINEEAAVRYIENAKVAPVQPVKKEDRPG